MAARVSDADASINAAPDCSAAEDPAKPAPPLAPPAVPVTGANDGDAATPPAPPKSEENPTTDRARASSRPPNISIGDGYAGDSFHADVAEAMSQSEAEPEKSAAQKLHTVFLYLSIPFAVICGIVAVVLYTNHTVEPAHASLAISGMTAFASSVLTIFLIYGHLTAYTNPVEQRLIIRILLLCPIYAIDSFVALKWYQYATVVNLIRDTYESYVIYMFFRLMVGYIGGEKMVLNLWSKEKQSMPHPFPMCCLPELKLNKRTLSVWKVCLLQYMVLNPILTLVSLPLYFARHDGKRIYDEKEVSASSVYVWFSAIKFISVTFAFTSLVYFYLGCKDFLTAHKPLGKFASIKIVVFLSFWQTVLLGALNHFKVIPNRGNWTSDEIATGLGNFVLCIEMYLIAVAHRWIFEDTPYVPAHGRYPLKCDRIKHAFGLGDVVDDTKETIALLTPVSLGSPFSKNAAETA